MNKRNLHPQRTLYSILFILLLCVTGITNIKAQTPYRQYAENGILLNFHEIDNVDFRVFLLYNISQNDHFILTQNEEFGQFSIIANDETETTDFYNVFETFYNNAYTDFSLLSKTDINDRMPVWKSNIDLQHFTSIIMDLTLHRFRSDNDQCINSELFCTMDIIDFEANSGDYNYQEEGVDYGCARSISNPSWYHMRIDESGQFIIHMEGHDPSNSNTLRDIDFVMWGPFVDPTSACDSLTSDKIIDCSYSPSSIEDAYLGYPLEEHIHNSQSGSSSLADGNINYHMPQTGEYYLLMITNYSRQPCAITFYKEEGSGPGTTDCSILPPIVDNGGPYCVGDAIHLHSVGSEYISHRWTGPNNFTSPYNNPIIPNCTMNMAGPYVCTLTHNGQTASDTTWVEIYPRPIADFVVTTACLGETTQFDASSSTTDPPGNSIARYEWDFGDGTTGSGVTTSHTYAQAGTYQVTLHVSDADNHCSDEVVQTVMVISPTAEDYYVTICEGESYTFNGVTYSQEGDYTITIQTQGCESTATLHLYVIDLDVQIETEPDVSICSGDTVMLLAASSYEFVAVGDILCTDGSIVKPAHWPCGKMAKGIVFYVDNTDLHGYAVSLTQSEPMKWSTENVLKLTTYTHWRDAIKDYNGYDNTQILRTGTTDETYPAVWAVDFDNGWYLPSAGQLKLLYNELMDVNANLSMVGGTPIEDLTGTYGSNNGDVYLWSSTEWNASQAMTVKVMDGMVKNVNKTTGDKYYVRAIINF